MLRMQLRTDIPLAEPDVDVGLVTWVDADVVDETETDLVAVARVRAAVIHVGEAVNVGVPIHEVLDADSAELEALHEVYFADDWLRDDYTAGAGNDLLFIESLDLQPRWRGRGIELAVVRRLSDAIGGGCAITVLRVDDDLTAHTWKRMGFEVTRAPTGAGGGYLHLRLSLRAPRVVEQAGGFRVALPMQDDEE